MLPFGSLDEVVEVGDVGLVVLAVVVVEGFDGDQLAEAVLVVGEFGEGEAHVRYLKLIDRIEMLHH